MKVIVSNIIARLKMFVKWMRTDGMLHASLSALILLFFCPIVGAFLGITIAIAIGVAKEIYDDISKQGTAEAHDLICDGIGILAGLIIYILYML